MPTAMRRYSFWTIAGLSILAISSSCTSTKTTFLDPIAYCAAVGTLDQLDERYIGPASPDWLEISLAKRLKLPVGPSAEALGPVAWRCAGGEVVACSFGMGMPCDKKPSTSRVPTKAAIEFCRAFPDIDRALPNLGTELSAYRWICRRGFPHLVGFQPDLDPEGYFKRYWFAIPPDDALSASVGGVNFRD